jgi:RND family efflux transporter MFP subunit
MTSGEPLNDASRSKHGRMNDLSSSARPIAWMLLGGLIFVAAAFPTGGYPPHDEGPMVESLEAQGDVELWTCGMHSEVIQEKPGMCPICGMDLVPVKKQRTREADAADHGYHAQGITVTIDPAVAQNMGLRVEPVLRRTLSRIIRTVGYVDYDQERMVSVTTRYEGVIEKVFVNYVGQSVSQGESLFEVYSPELVQTQQELLSAIQYARRLSAADAETWRRAESLVSSARQRLSYWDISDDQVAEIEDRGEVLRTLTVVSPLTGVVMQRMHGLEGMATRPGMEALHVADLSSLWLTVEVFTDQLPWLGVGSSASVSFDYFPGERFTGQVRNVGTEVSASTRTVKLTLNLPNHDGRLRVGMHATVIFRPVVARDAVVLPAQAVIRSGDRDVVVVALGQGRFAPRHVTLGAQSDGLIQVLDGLDGGEEVVTSGQFLIDSESNLRAAVQKMIASQRGHRHGCASPRIRPPAQIAQHRASFRSIPQVASTRRLGATYRNQARSVCGRKLAEESVWPQGTRSRSR